jgi:hypothetical protein
MFLEVFLLVSTVTVLFLPVHFAVDHARERSRP